METTIESPHFKINAPLQEYVTRKVNHLERFNLRFLWCRVILKLDKANTDDNKICEIKIHGPRNDFFASTKCSTFEDAVTITVHSIEKQIQKKKVLC